MPIKGAGELGKHDYACCAAGKCSHTFAYLIGVSPVLVLGPVGGVTEGLGAAGALAGVGFLAGVGPEVRL